MDRSVMCPEARRSGRRIVQQLAAQLPRGPAGQGIVRLVRSLPPELGDVFELRVSLRHIRPEVWRSLRVPADVPLGVLHEILQISFGWHNSHLHDFHVGDIRFGMAGIEDEMFSVEEHAAPLGAVARAGSKLLYRYDFGDDWEHDIVVESVESNGDETVRCTGGARACPPDDCGGPPGYEH